MSKKKIIVAKKGRLRIIQCMWQHKHLGEDEFQPQLVLPAQLNGNKNYSVEEVIEVFRRVVLRKHENHWNIIAGCIENIALGSEDKSNGTVITKFLDQDDEVCSIRDFLQLNRGNKRYSELLFLTEKVSMDKCQDIRTGFKSNG